MSEAVKKERKGPDPNSAAYKIGKVVADAYQDVFDAKARGEKIGWCSSQFPVEIPETLGLHVCYPENQAAAIAARGGGIRMCESSEGDGYNNDICAYARISLAYMKGEVAPEQEMPLPDYVLCCNNICNCMIKWYENIATELNIPLIMIDIPITPDYTTSPSLITYLRNQFWDAIHQLEEITGAKWSDERYKEVVQIARRSSLAWFDATAQAKYKPSPFNGFDLLNHMAVMVAARGKEATADAMETLAREWKENHENGVSTYKGEEKYRIMFEGIACWPCLRSTFSGLKKHGINMVTTIYVESFGFLYDDFDGMCRAYADLVSSMNLQYCKDRRVKLCKETHVEGILVHNNRSCKQWSGFMAEMCRQIGEECDIPVVSFDGDQADPRAFSEAQYETRVQGLVELMEARKGGENHVD